MMKKSIKNFLLSKALVFLCCFVVVNAVHAAKTAASKKMDYITVPDINSSFAQDSMLFEEELNHYSGVLTFKRNDVKISRLGNLDFTYSMSYQTNFPELPGWLEEIPRIEISYGEAYSGGTTTVFRPPSWTNGTYCSGKQEPLKPTSGRTRGFFGIPKSFFSTPKLIIPNQVNDILLLNEKVGSHSADRYITNSGWSISCNTNSISGNEGFIAKAPNGNKYYFDILANIGGIQQRPIQGGTTENIRLGEASQAYTADTWGQFHANKIKEAMFVSKIEDKFGNWIKFEYSPKQYKFPYSSLKHYVSNQLSKVITSDNQVISVDFVGNIKKITFNGRQWQYYNESEKFIVELPNKQKWQYDLDWSSATMPDIEGGTPACYLDYSGNSMTMNIVHPTGAKGRFLFELTRIDSANQYSGGTTCRTAFSLREKEISYGVNTSYNWRYDYSSNEGQKTGEAVSDKHKLKGALPENVDRYLNKTLTITLPDNSSIKEYINRDERSPLFGRINATEQYDSNSTLIRETKNSYQLADDIGSQIMIIGSVYGRTSPVNITAELITDSTSGDKYETRYSDFNFFGIAQLTHEKFSNTNSSIIREKYTRNTYINDYDNWVLNLLQKTYVSDNKLSDLALASSTPIREIEYAYFNDSNQLLPSKNYSYGQLIKTYKSYHAGGDIKKVELNAPLTLGEGNRTIEYSDYYRGIARTTKVQSRLSGTQLPITKEVDDNGWVTSITDLNGTTTGYAYDKLGRITAIDLANETRFGENYGNWLDTFITWIGNIRTIERCTLNTARNACTDTAQFATTETYDGLLRLTKLKTEDVLGGANSVRYQNFEYDDNNQNTFTSFISDTSTEIKGTYTTYDTLQRIETQATTGRGTVTYDYLAGNKRQVTDAENNITTTSYLAYGVPSYQQATKIESEENVSTDIAVNIFGLVESVTQSGFNERKLISQTETNIYDTNKQLCLKVRNDVGATAYGYNALGEMTWSAQGVVYNKTTPACIAKPTTNVINYIADNLGDIKQLDYSGILTPDVTYERDANGNVEKITAGDVVQTYHYNNQNILEDETLTIGSEKSYSLDYGYNALLQLSFTTYPDKTQVYYLANGYGEATQVASYTDFANSTLDYAYVKDATYYTNGMLNSFTYGNGIKHRTERDSVSWLPNELVDERAGIAPTPKQLFGIKAVAAPIQVMSLSYTYDNNLNITSVLNKVHFDYSINRLIYDKLDRLTSTEGEASAGSSTISYDGLGNILTYHNNSLNTPHNFSYEYDENNYRLTKVTTNNGASIVRDFSTDSSYDNRGNVLSNGRPKGINSFSYNLANQMITAGSSNHYVYDGFNRRVKANKAGNKVSYSMYNQSGKLMYRETEQGGINYYFLGSKLIAKEGTGVVLAKNKKPEDNTSSVMNYKPFGESIDEASDAVGYTGHKFDKDLGLNYMQARYYDPVIGRFYSNDPVGFNPNNIHSFGRYTYGNNNPYRYTDPDGRESKEHVSSSNQMIQAAKDFLSFSSGTQKMLTDSGATVISEAAPQTPDLGQASTVVGLVPGGTIPAVVLAVADAVITDDATSTTSAAAAGTTEAIANDVASDHGKNVPTNKVKAAIHIGANIVGTVAGMVEGNNQETQQVTEREEKTND